MIKHHLFLFFLLTVSNLAFAQVPDSSSRKRIIEDEQNNALPTLMCPVEIHFDLYNQADGYLKVEYANGKSYKQIDITYPQYPFVILDDCEWPKEKLKVTVYSLNHKTLNYFYVQPPANGKKEKWNCSTNYDLRKKSRRKN